ncbi:hypothetical protein ACQ86N_42170 [Puia sp. P3]|uniref:hypothetical protein n=1 Tax=Puia sp. P3 TaxID=3423952 RepID=UPI003D672358
MPVIFPKVRLAGLLLLLFLAFLLDISIGSVKIPLREVFHILFASSSPDSTELHRGKDKDTESTDGGPRRMRAVR